MFKKFTTFDKSLAGTVIILALIGAGAVFISSYHISLKNRGYPYYYGYNHVLSLIMAVPLTLIVSIIPVQIWKKYSVPLFFSTLFLTLLVFFPGVGKKVSGANRWIQIFGFSFQPSELLKIGMISCLSFMIVKKENYINNLNRGVLPIFLVISLATGIVALEPDMSTAIIIFVTATFLIYINNIRLTYLVLTLAMILPLSLYVFESKDYFMSRFLFFLANLDPYGRGYHILKALKSYRLGGFLGVKEDSLLAQALFFPDVHTDFIFSMLARIGGVGLLLFILILYIYMLYRCYRISLVQEDGFSRNLGLGITFLFSLEVLIHISVNVGLAPTTGSLLPFISYGRTAIFTHAIMLGIILNLSCKNSPKLRNTPLVNRQGESKK